MCYLSWAVAGWIAQPLDSFGQPGASDRCNAVLRVDPTTCTSLRRLTSRFQYPHSVDFKSVSHEFDPPLEFGAFGSRDDYSRGVDTMIQPNEILLNLNNRIDSHAAKAADSPFFSRRGEKARRCTMLVGILWSMILPLALTCLMGCAGFTPPKSPTAASSRAAPLRIATNALPVGAVQNNYLATLVATGGVPPYSWTQTAGNLPTGLTLRSAAGSIAGMPTKAGTFEFAIKVQDAKASTASSDFEVGVSISTTPTNTNGAIPTVNITAPSNGATVSGIVGISAAATGLVGSQASVQFYLSGSPLGVPMNSSPYAITWDSTEVADGTRNLSVVATDVKGNITTQAAVAVTVKNTSWNPAVLGVPWAADFISIAANEVNVKTDSRLKVKATGDGVTDDTAAIRAAINLASSSGGGVVYFPTGDYKIITPSNSVRGGSLAVPSRVILRGSSSTTSRIFVNDPNAGSETDGTWTWGGISFQGSSLSGMTDLGVFAVSSSNGPCAVLWNRGSTKVSELFFNELDVHLDNCRSFWFDSTNDLLIQNSRFDSGSSQVSDSSQNGPVYVVMNSNVSFINNKVTYHFGRVHMQQNTNLLVQGNTLIRDAENRDMDDGNAIESGGIELSFGQNIQVLNNTIQTINGPSDEAGDGEAIMSQQSNTRDVLDAGASTAITSTTLSDTSALWGSVTASRIAQYPEVVAILTGSGTGEWRTIQGLNTSTKTLTLNQPWSPIPEVGSLYSIFVWTLIHANIQGNTLTDNPNGIVLYDGCYDCTVQNNVLTNSRQIILRAADGLLNQAVYPEGRRVHQVAIEVTIVNNTVSNTSGKRPAYIALDAEAFAENNYKGMGMLNIQVGQNTINPYSADPDQAYPNPKQTEITQEGFFPCFLFGPAAVKDPITTVFRNIKFWNNSQSSRVNYTNSFMLFTTRGCISATQ